MKTCACCGRGLADRKPGDISRVVHTGRYEVTAPVGKVKFDLTVKLLAPKGTRVCESCIHASLIVSLAALQGKIQPKPTEPLAMVPLAGLPTRDNPMGISQAECSEQLGRIISEMKADDAMELVP